MTSGHGPQNDVWCHFRGVKLLKKNLGGSLPEGQTSFPGAHSGGLCWGGQGLARTAGGDQELVEQQLVPWSNSGGGFTLDQRSTGSGFLIISLDSWFVFFKYKGRDTWSDEVILYWAAGGGNASTLAARDARGNWWVTSVTAWRCWMTGWRCG